MREKRQSDFRSRSPPQPTSRDRTRHSRFSGPVRSEPERSRQQLSEFNETLAPRESTSMKFQWDHLLAEKPAKPNSNVGSDVVVPKSMENERSTYSTVVTTSKYYGLNGNRYDLGLQRNDHSKSNELITRDFGFSRSREMANERFGHDGSVQKPVFKSSAMSEFQGNDRYGRGDNQGVKDDFRRQNAGRVSIVDSIVDKIYGTDSTRSRILNCDPSLHVMERDGEDLGYRSCHVEYEAEGYPDCNHGFERGSGSGLPEHDEDEGSHQQMLTADELRFQDSQRMLKRKLVVDLTMISENPNDGSLSNDEIHDPSWYGDEQWTNGDIQQLPLLKSPGYEHSPVGRAGRVFDEMASQRIADSDDWLPSPDLSAPMQQHSGQPIKTSGRNIKERLGPASRDIKQRLGPASRDIKQRLGPASRDIKKRLGPAQTTPKSNRRVNNLLLNQSLQKNLNDIHESLNVQGGDSSKGKAKRAKTKTHIQGNESLKAKAKCSKTEPPEDSEEFKQRLHISFLKFVKALNENSALRRRYMEQGGAGTLKCSICGSNSKEFMDTLSLAQHAFTSRVVGSRPEHLGFHKALCVLMGWNSAAALNRPWVRQILPDGEALALKEDLIIWPPVVVIHNSSIANCNPDERLIVSIEELSAILRGVGFGRGMAKVCHGRPANQSVMVVSFQGTFSGLEEAERLHEFYAKNNHGRAEFKQIAFSSSNSSHGGTQIVLGEKVGNILYGHLGIADDLDKLDFQTKGHSVVKSKKEIQAIAGAPLNSK